MDGPELLNDFKWHTGEFKRYSAARRARGVYFHRACFAIRPFPPGFSPLYPPRPRAGDESPRCFHGFLVLFNAGFKFSVTRHLNTLLPKFSTSFNARFNFSTTALWLQPHISAAHYAAGERAELAVALAGRPDAPPAQLWRIFRTVAREPVCGVTPQVLFTIHCASPSAGRIPNRTRCRSSPVSTSTRARRA